MNIEPINSVVGVSPATASAEYARQAHLSPSQAHLAESQARAAETPEQLADGGDPIAIAQVSAEAQRLTPASSRHLEPPLPHPATTHEPGKGERIDVYD